MGKILHSLRHYADFKGKSDWTEWSLFILFAALCCLLAYGLDLAMGWDRANVVPWLRWHPSFELTRLALLIPCLAVTARRLHAVERSRGWCLLGLVPILGWIGLIALIAPDREGE